MKRISTYISPILLLGTLMLFSASSIYSAELELLAEFKPDPANPARNLFVNKTPQSGFCATNQSRCEANNMFSLRIATKFASNAPITANHTDPRQGALFKIPTEWRTFTVTHRVTGEQEPVEIRIKAFGSQYRTSDRVALLVGQDVSNATGHLLLWGEAWYFAPAGCNGLGHSLGFNSTDYNFFWQPTGDTPCSKQAKFDIPGFAYNYLEFAYEIKTPNPLGMSTGEYIGNFTYMLGPNQDFDMGDLMIPTDPVLSLNFTLEVQHTLKVGIPPGANKVELTPKGGWQQWLQKGRIAEKIYRDQSFLISASSRFKMQLACERQIGDTCAISNGSHEVPVDVQVSMPNGIANNDDSSVSRKPLGVTTEQQFKSTFYVEQKPSTLHFEIQKRYVEEMMTEQGKYSGNITVIWDSEV